MVISISCIKHNDNIIHYVSKAGAVRAARIYLRVVKWICTECRNVSVVCYYGDVNNVILVFSPLLHHCHICERVIIFLHVTQLPLFSVSKIRNADDTH